MLCGSLAIAYSLLGSFLIDFLASCLVVFVSGSAVSFLGSRGLRLAMASLTIASRTSSVTQEDGGGHFGSFGLGQGWVVGAGAAAVCSAGSAAAVGAAGAAGVGGGGLPIGGSGPKQEISQLHSKSRRIISSWMMSSAAPSGVSVSEKRPVVTN